MMERRARWNNSMYLTQTCLLKVRYMYFFIGDNDISDRGFVHIPVIKKRGNLMFLVVFSYFFANLCNLRFFLRIHLCAGL